MVNALPVLYVLYFDVVALMYTADVALSSTTCSAVMLLSNCIDDVLHYCARKDARWQSMPYVGSPIMQN